jgi:hypothetical protein
VETARLVLDYLRTLIWPGVVVVALVLLRHPLERILDRFSKVSFKAFGVEGSVEAATRIFQRRAASAARTLTAPPPGADQATSDLEAEDRRASAPRRGARTAADEAARREAVAELLTEAAIWGWQVAQLGQRQPPVVGVRWELDGQPRLSLETAPAPEDRPAGVG